VGDACVSLTGGWGATISGNSGCHELTTALTITQKGGLIKGDARSFGAADEYGFVLNAGGGEVDLEGINDGADVALFNITNASSVTIANVMTLSGNRTSDSPKHYDVEISQSQNITILDNVFMANAESDLSTNSISVYLAPGDQKATISGNVFEDPGTGIDIAAGDTDGSSRPHKTSWEQQRPLCCCH
jgi:pectate lyase